MIGISGLFVRNGTVGGAEYMLYNLLYGLLDHPRARRATLLVGREADLDPAFRFRVNALGADPGVSVVEVGGRFNRFVEESFRVPAVARARGLASVLFPNYYTPPRRQPFRVTTVIHDLQYRHLPLNFSARKRRWLSFAHRATLRYADHVVTISRFVRDDVLRVYGSAHEKKVHVIPNPVSWARFDRAPASPSPAPERPYILSVASHYPHKNLETLIRAFSLARRSLPDHRLVLVGQVRENLRGVPRGGGGAVDVQSLIRELGLTGEVVAAGHVPDETLGSLYRGAELFVLPSLFEGFGMPAVEALGMGIPTLTTRCTSLPEVTLGKAAYVEDPRSVDELAATIVEMVARRSAFVPGPADVRRIRDRYAPPAVAEQYLGLLA